MERHLYSAALPMGFAPVPLPPADPTPLTDITVSAWYNVNFSPQAGYYVLGYEGPNVPWQKVVSIQNTSELPLVASDIPNSLLTRSYAKLTAFDYPLANNDWLNATSLQYQMPVISRMTIDSDGYGETRRLVLDCRRRH